MLIALYLSAIVLANLSVAVFGAASTAINAFLFVGLTLSTRDRLHDAWGGHVKRNMALLIAAGAVLTLVINVLPWFRFPGVERITGASIAAFASSEAVDAAVYHLQRHRPFLVRSNTSNVFGAAVDSVVFPVLAFGGFPVAIVLGQFAAKVLGGLVWSLVLQTRRRPLTRQPS